MILEPEIGRQPALAANAAPERRRLEVAREVVDPGVVDAVELLGAPEFLAAHEVAPVRATVDQRVQPSIVVAAHDDRRVADARAS